MQKILLVEDDKYIRESLHEFLADEGFEVIPSSNGLDALTRLKAGLRPQLILLDLMMPLMDGFQFREVQLESQELAAIPVVVMSAYGDFEKNKEKLGVEAYLKKPLDIEEVLSTIQKWCLA